jgi:hypothetical protein
MITPSDSPSSPGDYAGVTPHGRGPAPYDIQAPAEDLSGVFAEAGVLSGGEENGIYPVGPRQQQIAGMMHSSQGFAADGYDIDAGWHGGGGGEWPNNVAPGG